MKLIGLLVSVGLICAASAKLPMADRKYKFLFKSISLSRSTRARSSKIELGMEWKRQIIFANIYF
jgi:hypothetical protein